MAAARRTGSSHRAANRECQDAFQWATPREGLLIAAVADGAGSRGLSSIGSRIAARRAIEAMSDACRHEDFLADDQTCRDALLQAASAARDALVREAQSHHAALDEFATTLILAAISGDVACAIQIGDGAAVIGRPTGEVESLTKPMRGACVNETFFLTTGAVRELAQVAIHRGVVERVALFTDGLQSFGLELPAGEAFAPFFRPLFQFIGNVKDRNFATQQIVALLRSRRVADRSDDDLTLVLAGWNVENHS